MFILDAQETTNQGENYSKIEIFDPNFISKTKKCQRCDQIFKNKNKLIDHQTIIFESLTKNKNTSLKFCTLCPFKSCNVLGLICHKKNEHTEIDCNNENSQNNANHKTFENKSVTEDFEEDISDYAFEKRHAKAEIYERLNKKSDKKCDRYKNIFEIIFVQTKTIFRNCFPSQVALIFLIETLHLSIIYNEF